MTWESKSRKETEGDRFNREGGLACRCVFWSFLDRSKLWQYVEEFGGVLLWLEAWFGVRFEFPVL